jgi:outer membrane immunogenic protein
VKKIIVAGIAAAAFCGAPAFASDMPVRAPVYKAAAPVPYDPWAGFYVGIEGGEGWSRTHVVIPGTAFDTGSIKGHGGLIGGTVGYNWQWTNWVAGIEADYGWSHIAAIGHDAAVFPTCTAGGIGQCGATLESFGTARGRLGYSFNRLLVYGTAGLGFGDLKGIISNPGSAITGTGSKTNTGFVYGGGLEAMLGQNWTAKIEYLHVDLGDGPVVTNGTARQALDWKTDIVRVGLNYKFGDPWGKSPVAAKY